MVQNNTLFQNGYVRTCECATRLFFWHVFRQKIQSQLLAHEVAAIRTFVYKSTISNVWTTDVLCERQMCECASDGYPMC
jgi:hypothetical protein